MVHIKTKQTLSHIGGALVYSFANKREETFKLNLEIGGITGLNLRENLVEPKQLYM